MGLSLTLYHVDLTRVRATIGSRDDKLRRQLGGRFKADMARADQWFASAIEGGAPTRHDALRAVIEGGPFDERYGFQYGYAYELICRHFGKYLDNNSFSPYRGDWLEEVDHGLSQLGISAVKVGSFMVEGLPAPLPAPDDFPGYGEWSESQCRDALNQWTGADEVRRAAVDAGAMAAIESCIGWMHAVLAKPGSGIAGFGY